MQGAVLAALLALLGGGASAGRAAESEPAPEAPEAILGSGSIEDFRWVVYAGREDTQGDPRVPCLKVATGEGSETGYGTSARTCGPLERPLVNGLGTGAGEETRTALAMALSPRARSVRLWLKGRKSRRIGLRRLGVEQSQLTGLARFRYLVEDFSGPFCLQRYAVFDAAGDRLWVSPAYECAWNWLGDRERR
jgi:hypothetical protein